MLSDGQLQQVTGTGADGGPWLTKAVATIATAEVSGHLPIVTRATAVILMTGPGRDPAGRPGPWRTMAAFRLGAA